MIVLGRRFKASRWPWQEGYGWGGSKSGALLNPKDKNGYSARFGGGWKYQLGVSIGGSTVLLNLLYGTINISKAQRCRHCNKWIDGNTGGFKEVKLRDGHLALGWDLHKACYEALLPFEEPVANPKDRDDAPF